MTSTRVLQRMLTTITASKKPSRVIFTPGMLCDQRLWQPSFQLLPNIDKHFIDFNDCADIKNCFTKIAQQANQPDFSLIGFSMGGFIALEHALFAEKKPSALVLISASARGYTETETLQRKKIIQMAEESFSQLTTASRLGNWVDQDHYQHDEIVALLKQMVEKAGAKRLIHQQSLTLKRQDRREHLKSINEMPVLIIHGENDKLIPASHAEELARLIPNATCKIIKNCGHMVPLEKPLELANILTSWLNDNAATLQLGRKSDMQKTSDVYTLRRGKAGEERLNVLNEIYNADSENFLMSEGIASAKQILDVGCGTGQMACWIAKTNPSCHITCVDISEDQLSVAKQNAKNAGLTNMSFHQCSAYELEKLDKQFDFIYTRFVLAHIQDPLKALQSMHAVLTPNGKLACEEAKTSEHYCSPSKPDFDRYFEIWDGLRRAKGADPELGTKLEKLYNEINCTAIKAKLVTKDLPYKDRTRLIFEYNLNEIGDEAIKLGLTTPQELAALKTSISQLAQEKNVTLRFSGSVQTVGTKSLELQPTIKARL